MIRHLTQLDNALRNDCGQACCAMLVNAYQSRALSIEQVARATSTDKGKFTPFYKLSMKDKDGRVIEVRPGLFDILGHYGVKAAYTGQATIGWYRETVARGVPVIALVDYSAYTDNPLAYEFAHFLLVVGVSDTHVTVNDPLRTKGNTLIPLPEFVKSINQQSAYVKGYDAEGAVIKGYNNANQAMYPLQALVMPDKTAALSGAWAAFDAIRGWAA